MNDPVKFFSQMQELHNFGGRAPSLPKQAHTWLEKFHAWKHRLWAWIRDFIRAQFSPDSRHKIRLWEMGGGEKEIGTEGRKLRAGAGAQSTAGGFGLELDGARRMSNGRARTSRSR